MKRLSTSLRTMTTATPSQNSQQIDLCQRKRWIEGLKVRSVHRMNITTVLNLKNRKAIQVEKNIHLVFQINRIILQGLL